jgi:hypothetical protein
MRSTAVLLTILLGCSAATAEAATERLGAAPKLGKTEPKGKATGKAAPPTAVEKKVKVSPDGLKFGMTIEEISKLYDKVFDDEFVPLYQHVEPGPRMAELDSELADKKHLVLRNKLEFGTLPSGLDDTPLGGEYTYNNGESMTQLKLRSGTQRYFFFFGNRLWKVIDVHKLGKNTKLGADYDGAVEGLTKQLGKAPRILKADPTAGRKVDQVDWEDKETILRVLDFGGGTAAVAYVDRKTEEGIDKYRSNKGEAHEEVSSAVSDVTRSTAPKADPTAKAGSKGKK